MAELSAITDRLKAIAAALRDPERSDADAEAMAREAADLVAKASNEIDRAARPDGER